MGSSMRQSLFALAAFAVSVLAVPAQAEVWGIYNVNGNDTGGIIPWRPDVHRSEYLEAADRHCAGYKKLARITSVHPRYGDYVVFACQFPRHYDPVKRGDWWYGWPHY